MTDKHVHIYPIRIYYKDTDAGGIVYYANYLRFFERGRTEMLRAAGFNSSTELHKSGGFVVVNVDIAYKTSARLDDMIEIRTSVQKIGRSSLILSQNAYRDDTLLTQSTVTLCLVNKDGRPTSLPADLKQALENRE